MRAGGGSPSCSKRDSEVSPQACHAPHHLFFHQMSHLDGGREAREAEKVPEANPS